MTSRTTRHAVPDDYGVWWSAPIQVRWRDLDELGHVTASCYALFVEEAVGSFMQAAWSRPDPTYVAAHVSISYLREIRLDDGPLRVFVSALSVDGSRFSCAVVIAAADGTPRAVARGDYSGWDPERRRARNLTGEEIGALASA